MRAFLLASVIWDPTLLRHEIASLPSDIFLFLNSYYSFLRVSYHDKCVQLRAIDKGVSVKPDKSIAWHLRVRKALFVVSSSVWGAVWSCLVRWHVCPM